MRWFLVVALFAISCNSKKSASKGAGSSATPTTTATSGKADMSKFTLAEDGNESNKVTVELAVPSSWQADPSEPASWKTDGALGISITNVSTGGSDNAARLEQGIKMQFGDMAGATRNDYPDGRAWVTKTQPNGNLHARMFIPYAGGVVMGIAMLRDKAKADSVKAAFETMKIVQ